MPPEELSTTTDPRARTSWAIHDPVIRLREWASDRVHGLPDPPVAAKIGSVSSCQLQLHDPSGLLSREHAMLTPLAGGGWRIRDLGSKNGLRRDGERRPDFKLRPGLEITIGGLRLVAESAQLVGLRAVLCRFLGWAPERQADVDNALRSLRDWAEHDRDADLGRHRRGRAARDRAHVAVDLGATSEPEALDVNGRLPRDARYQRTARPRSPTARV